MLGYSVQLAKVGEHCHARWWDCCNDVSDLSRRVDTVKEENLKLKSENLVLGQYIENLMEASAIFQSTIPQAKKYIFLSVVCPNYLPVRAIYI